MTSSDREQSAEQALACSIEISLDASPFSRRVAHRLRLAARAGVQPPAFCTLLVTDEDRRQAAVATTGNRSVIVADLPTRPGVQRVSPAADLIIDFPSGRSTTSLPAGTAEDALAKLLAEPALPSWPSAADQFWQRCNDLAGMPAGLTVRCTDTAEVAQLGDQGSTFTTFARQTVLQRLFAGDLLYEEALFGHRVRMEGALATVSVLIGAFRQEALDDWS